MFKHSQLTDYYANTIIRCYITIVNMKYFCN